MAVNLQTIKEIRNFLASELAGIYPGQEINSIAVIVLSYVFNKDRLHLLADEDEPAAPGKIDEIVRICNELKTGRPVQYITGETIFYGCRIKVNPDVLIPRPETEELVDLILKENREYQGEILDIGTGSGCIAIALAANLPHSKVTATDISGAALATAAENAIINNVEIRFLISDVKNPDIMQTASAGIIVSNPPYVPDSDKSVMHKNILGFEPHEALFVRDNDPLAFYRAIFDAARHILEPRGKIYFEIGEKTAAQILELFESYKYSGVKIIRDINGKDRIAKGIKND